jgi:hypothetical protein
MLTRAKSYCYPDLFEWCKNQGGPWAKSEYYFQVHSGEYGDWPAVKRMREKARLEAIFRGVDGLLFIDADTIPPLTVIADLVASGGDMITGIYMAASAPQYAVAWKYDDPHQDFLREKVSTIDGAGLGCCLIHRKVLEACTFDDGEYWDDYPFWTMAAEKGFRCLSVNTVRCKHYIAPGECLYPPPGGGYLIRCPDGVTINGKAYKGRIYHDLESVMYVDGPYRRGEVKASSSVGGGFSPMERTKSKLEPIKRGA